MINGWKEGRKVSGEIDSSDRWGGRRTWGDTLEFTVRQSGWRMEAGGGTAPITTYKTTQ